MTLAQEDALYEFLENTTGPFDIQSIISYIHRMSRQRPGRLGAELELVLRGRHLAFPLEERGDAPQRWISRRGYFEPARFVISPTRLELMNGILIPGHRCVPFVNPALLPQSYTFYWQHEVIPATTSEGSPEDFYPYYTLYGEEYAPQYVAQDNPENESSFSEDLYEDPLEVSIQTIDMRNVYRESAFVPGDRFVVRVLDWMEGKFELEKVGKDAWRSEDLDSWFAAAEAGFIETFKRLGPGDSTEQQIAFAYWYGGPRMREVPAWSLEDYLFEKTGRIEIVAYGIETRFWYAGKEIPDRKCLEGGAAPPAARSVVEEILYRRGVPVSEYVVHSYVVDSLFRGDPDPAGVLERLVPRAAELSRRETEVLLRYILEILEDFREEYTVFSDQYTGPVRQRVGELHTAIVELSTGLQKGEIDPAWLPGHTFVVLSQIQNHAADILEDLVSADPPDETELASIDASLDNMIDTYEDLKEQIDAALESFRRNKFSLLKSSVGSAWRTVQIGIGGAEIWRRLILPQTCRLTELQDIIRVLFGWNDLEPSRFILGEDGTDLTGETCLQDLADRNVPEICYEYGDKWTVKIMLLSAYDAAPDERIRCVAGEGAAPPAFIAGPVPLKRYLAGLERGGNTVDFRREWREPDPGSEAAAFDLEACNRELERRNYGKQ
jgi:hypothetical protein